MKKWSSIILSAAVALSIPASAYATGDRDSGAHVESVVSIDGKMDAKWLDVDKIAFTDAATGAKGFYRLMWDDGHLYVLVELEGAAKLWDKDKIPTLLSLWYNTDGNVQADGSLSLVYPNLIERHDNGLHLGWFKGDKVVKAQAVSGDNAVIELELPWEHKEGKKLEKDCKIGFGAVLKALDKVKADANGEFIIDLKAEDVAKIKPEVLNLITLFGGSMDLGLNGNVNGNGNGNVNGNLNGNVNGNGTVTVGGNTNVTTPGLQLGTVKVELIGELNGGRIVGSFEDGVDTAVGTTPGTTTTGGSNTGGTPATTTPGTVTGGTTGGSGTDTGSGTDNTDGEAVLGISTGAIPSAMPKTGGGGASDWID